VADPARVRGLVDTSVVIDLERVQTDALPDEIAIASITLAELAAGPHATDDPAERASRQERLQRVESTFDAIPFDSAAARAYGRVYAEVAAAGRKARGRRAIDLLIAATAVAAELPLYTRNPSDFEGLSGVLEVIAVETSTTAQ
jgi:hypothetical protein